MYIDQRQLAAETTISHCVPMWPKVGPKNVRTTLCQGQPVLEEHVSLGAQKAVEQLHKITRLL